jgi:hypothetical protein
MRKKMITLASALLMSLALLLPALLFPGAALAEPLAWEQISLDGFGNADNLSAFSMAVCDGALYAGTYNGTDGCQVWRYDGPTAADWTQINFDGFLDLGPIQTGYRAVAAASDNWIAYSMAEYGGKLYVGTGNSVSGCQVWRYDGPGQGDWTQVNAPGFGNAGNTTAASMQVFDGKLWVGSGSDSSGAISAEVWAYDGNAWAQMNNDGFGVFNNRNCRSMTVLDGDLYAGAKNNNNGFQVWRYDGPTTADWTQVASGGIDNTGNSDARSMCVYEGDNRLYLGAGNSGDGATMYVYDPAGGIWTNLDPPWMDSGDPPDAVRSMLNYHGYLYLGLSDDGSAAEIWKYDGVDWEKMSLNGFVDPTYDKTAHSMVVYEDLVWVGSGYESEGVTARVWRAYDSPPSWYLAEGCTREGFETWVLMENPNAYDVTASLVFDTEAGEVVLEELQGLTLPATSRTSVLLNAYYPGHDVSTRVISEERNIVCERAMYNAERTWATESVGTNRPANAWYLAEGCTIGADTWVLVENPYPAEVAFNVSFLTDKGLYAPGALQNVPLGANTRYSLHVNDYVDSFDASTIINSTSRVVCERSMYGPDRAWAHTSIGAPDTGDTWYLAEGCTVGMETWVLVQNPGADPLKVDLTFLTENGEVQGPTSVIPAFSRRSFSAGDYVQSYDVSTLVTSKYGEVVCERAMYGPERAWGTCSVGTTMPANRWLFAEGSTDGGMDTWILVENPWAVDATVSLTLNTDSGQVTPAPLQNVTVPAMSRMSFHLNDYLTTYDVSTQVDSNLPVVCERAMYGPDRAWATDSIGFGRNAI